MTSEGELPSALERLDIGITLHDPETAAVVDVNAALEELYGYTREELRTMDIEDYTAPSTKYTQELAVEQIREAANGIPHQFEWQIERSNGERRWVRVHLSPVTLDGTKYVTAEIQDISGYKAREQRLRLLSRIVRHNLRNEMNVLMGHADHLREAVEDDDLESTAETVFEIATEVGTLSDSITQLEEIASPTGTERSPTNLTEVARSVVENARSAYPAATVTLDAPTDVWVIADQGIEYAVSHAVENAVEHNGGRAPTVIVSVESDPVTDEGVIRITDDGPPIPDVEIEVLDEATETTGTYHGSGVGLYVMQWCVDSLGGVLRFESNEPRGNVVSMILPRVSPEQRGQDDE